MKPQQRLAVVLANWAKAGHSQIEFARLTSLAPSGVSRMFSGDQHPDVDTFDRILAAIAPQHPQLAIDLLEAYLLDHIPEGTAPDGRPWTTLVRILVEEITPAQLIEGTAVTELELAKAWWTKRTETPDGQRWLLTLYRWSQPKVTLYQKPDRKPPKLHAVRRPNN